MATSGYGATAPGALDPFSIESTLANIVGTNNPAAAGGALDLYQLQNQVSKSNYGYDQAQQHAYAKEALKQQLLETQMKEFHNIAKLPGGARFLAAGGIPGMDFGGAPGALTGLAEAGDVAQGAENFSKAGSGFSSFSEGGYLVDPSMVPGLPPNMRGTLTDNAKVRAAQIDANAKIASAGMHAASAKGPKINVPYKFNAENGEEITIQVPIPIGASPDETKRLFDAARTSAGYLYKPGSGVPGQTSPGVAAPQQPAPLARPAMPPGPIAAPQPPPPTTGLQPKPAPAPASAPTGQASSPAVAASTQTVTDPTAQRQAQWAYRNVPMNTQDKIDIGANIQGGVMPVVPLVGGGYGYAGKSGRTYRIPGAPGGKQ